jgi:hypothetical protein
MRPDKIGVMFEKLPSGKVVLALAQRRDWRTDKITVTLKDIYQIQGVTVVADDRLALLPDGVTAEQAKNEIMAFAKEHGS